MKIKSIVAAVFAIACVSSALAVCDVRSCTGVGKEVVVSIYPNHTGKVSLEAPVGKESLNCTLVGSDPAQPQFMSLNPNHVLFKEIYSAILMAITTKRKFTVRIAENSPDCEVVYVRVWTES